MKCKKILNIRCLRSREWGANKTNLKNFFYTFFGFLIGVEANELADNYAKVEIKQCNVNMTVTYSKTEIKSLIRIKMKKKWQEEWDISNKG